MLQFRHLLSAGASLSLSLLAFPPVHAQAIRSTAEVPHSIISLAPAPRPQGQLLARNAKEATFEHVPANYHVFAAATAGDDAGVETLRLNFAAETRLTKIHSKNKDFVVEAGGTCHEGNSYKSGDSCSLQVRFNPQGPGHRSGSLSIAHSAEVTPMFVGLTGNGYGPILSFTPSQIVTVPGTVSANVGTINSATNLSVDGGDILYIPDVGNNIIKEIDSSGTIATVNPYFATPQSLVADSSGILYSINVSGSTYYFSAIFPWGTQTAYGTPHAAGTCTPSTPCSLGTVGMTSPANMSIDPYDNLFFEEGTKGAAEMPVANIGGGSGTFNLWYLSNQFIYTSGSPAPFAVDPSDNIYDFYTYNGTVCYLQAESAYSAEYSPVIKRVAGGAACGFSGDGGQARSAEISTKVGQIAFDIAGNLYFADAGNQRIRRIDATTGIISTIAGNGIAGYAGDGSSATTASISNPTGVAVDSQGQVYILSSAPTAGTTQVVRKVNTLGYWNYGSQLIKATSAVKVFTVSNTGNSTMTIASAAALTGANASDFSIDPTTTNCVLTAGATLAAGQTCYIGIKFTPAAAGSRTANLTLMDNTVTGSNNIRLNGTGTLPLPTMTITAPATGATVKAGVATTFSVTVTSTSTTKPTGTVTFKVNGANVGSPVTLSSTGTASTTFTESSAATYTLSAVYSGDVNYSTVTVTKSQVVSAAVKAVSKVLVSRGITAFASCGLPTLQVRVSTAAGDSPTGVVLLKSGNSTLNSATLTRGVASLAPGHLSVGAHSLAASYEGDSQHMPAVSAPITLVVPETQAACTAPRPPTRRMFGSR